MHPSQRTYLLDKMGLSAAIFTAIGWGIAGIFIQLMPNISLLSLVAARLTLALIVFTPVLFLKSNSFFSHITPLRQPITWGLSAILFACYTLGTLSFQLAPVGEATLLMTTAPLFVILFRFVAREHIHKNEYVGATLAFIGITIVMLPGLVVDSELTQQRIIGDIMALLVSILFATYAMWSRALHHKEVIPSTMSITLGTFILGFILALFVLPQDVSEHNGTFNHVLILSFIGLGIVSTAIPTITYNIAAKRLTPLMTSGILLFEPVLAIVFAFLILNEIPSIWIAPGVLFILIGLALIGRTK